MKKSREFLKAHNLCYRCGKVPAMEGRTICPRCWEILKESKARIMKAVREGKI